MSEILSQDQINSLLGQQSTEGGVPGGDNDGAAAAGAFGGGAAERDYSLLSNVFEIFNEQASTVISTVLNKDISLSIQQCQKADREVLMSGAAHEMLMITAPFKSGVTGSLYCIMGKRDVAMLSDLMMMGDGTAEFTEDHKDAITELFSQVMGAYTNALGEKIGEQVGNGTLSASEYDTANLPFSVEESDMAGIVFVNCRVEFVAPSVHCPCRGRSVAGHEDQEHSQGADGVVIPECRVERFRTR